MMDYLCKYISKSSIRAIHSSKVFRQIKAQLKLNKELKCPILLMLPAYFNTTQKKGYPSGFGRIAFKILKKKFYLITVDLLRTVFPDFNTVLYTPAGNP